MSGWELALDTIGLTVLAVVLAAGFYSVALVIRRRILRNRGASFLMSVNALEGSTVRGWTLGLGVYSDLEVEWYRTYSLSLSPHCRFGRSDVHVVSRRQPEAPESYVLGDDNLVLEVDTATEIHQLAMSRVALTAFLVWLESSPPGGPLDSII